MDDDEVTMAIRRCQAGDMEGLSILIGHFQLPAQQFALLLTGDRTIAEDLVQDSFFTGLSRYQAISDWISVRALAVSNHDQCQPESPAISESPPRSKLE